MTEPNPCSALSCSMIDAPMDDCCREHCPFAHVKGRMLDAARRDREREEMEGKVK